MARNRNRNRNHRFGSVPARRRDTSCISELVRQENVHVGRNRQITPGEDVKKQINTIRKENEQAFFEKFFVDEPHLLEEYQRRVSTSDGVIDWDFLPKHEKVARQRKSEQYRKALYYVQDELKSSNVDQLNELKSLAEKVIRDREREIENHRKVSEIWKNIRDTIDNRSEEIRFLETRVPMNSRTQRTGENERSSSQNFFLRLLCCCCS